MDLREATKGYKNLVGKLLGKHDLDPAIERSSPLEIAEALRGGNNKQEKVDDIKAPESC